MTPIAYKDRIQQYHGFKMNIDDEISKAFKKCPFCAETIQIEAVKCRYCGEWIEGGAATRAPAKYSDAQPVWHLVLLSIATFSLYNIYWVYRTWRQLRDQGSWNISPEWRLLGLFVPILGIILLYDFFKHVRNFAVTEKCESLFPLGRVFIGWIFFNALAFIPFPYSFLSLLNVWPIGVVQSTLNNFWSKKQPTSIMRTNFSVAQMVLVILGGIFRALAIIGLTMTDYNTAPIW